MNSRISVAVVLTALVVGSAMVAGCERPFVELRGPDLAVVQPDLDFVQTERTITLLVQTTSQDRVDSVLLNGLRMTEEASDQFSITLNLHRGVNELDLMAFGGGGAVRRDTARAVFLPGQSDVAELRLPAPRGGHTTTRLQNGDLLVAGGSDLPTRPAVAEALVYSAANLSLQPKRVPMHASRMEHTASRLPNGRVLIVGGSIVSEPNLVSELVETVELFDPGADSVSRVPVGGDPIRRSGHAAVLFPVRQDGAIRVFLYLYGGRGDIRYRPEARMGIRSDIRVFEYRNDSLVAAGPTFGPFIDPITDHSVTEIQPAVGSEADFLFSGSYFVSEDVYESIAFESRFSLSSGIFIQDLEPMITPRSGHAAERMVDGEIIVFGGRTFSPTTAMGTLEVYHSRTKRFYAFPAETRMLQERWGHTATNWDGNRILVVGGFGFAGAGLATSEWFVVEPRPQ